jgi:hypothetical protein
MSLNISVNLSALRQAKWYQFALRFLFGGAICVLAGIIANKYGPALGGLFMAFPAIFPASATLLENEQQEKKERAGLHGTIRGRKVAGVDAAGAAMGSIGMMVFAEAACSRGVDRRDGSLVWRFCVRLAHAQHVGALAKALN